MRFEGASLTLFSARDGDVIGELSDATWAEEVTDTGTNYVISGLASDGTTDSIQELSTSGVDTFDFDFETGGELFHGRGMLLRPQRTSGPTEISLETPDEPKVRVGDKAFPKGVM
ncbi:MAG TPA: hypothetical protein VG944_02320 [Fimbriimonas sp.]|nr:hypothetical protein [Fimbriimonas sp.]